VSNTLPHMHTHTKIDSLITPMYISCMHNNWYMLTSNLFHITTAIVCIHFSSKLNEGNWAEDEIALARSQGVFALSNPLVGGKPDAEGK